MIPRARPNYGFRTLWRSLFVARRSTACRTSLREHLAGMLGEEAVILTASGRGALYLYLQAMPQRRVIVPAYTCKAVVEAATLAGKEVVFASHEPAAFNASPEAMTEHADPDTVVVATHQFGIPCDIVRTVELAKAKGAIVIEDVAAALGTKIQNQLAGTFGDAAFFSFDTTKLVNAPLKAGFLTVRDPDDAARCRDVFSTQTEDLPILNEWMNLAMAGALVLIQGAWRYRWFHTLKFRWRNRFTEDGPTIQETPGPFYRYRMSERQACIVLPQLEQLGEIIRKRQDDYRQLLEGLNGVAGITLPPADVARAWAPIRFPILVENEKMAFYERACELGVDMAFSFTFIQAPASYREAHAMANAILNPPFYLRLNQNELQKTMNTIQTIDGERSSQAR